MRYVEPRSLEEAAAELSRDPDARCIAGGVTLVAMMNAELVAPTTLVGLRRVPGLSNVRVDDNGIHIGALTTYSAIAEDSRLTGAAAVVRSAAGQVAHVSIRNQGTIGGAVCHADPAADMPTALTAADASVEIFGTNGARTLPVSRFFQGYLQTALEPGELVASVTVPHGGRCAVSHYLKFARSEGDYATISIAVVLSEKDGRCAAIRIAVGAAGPIPLHRDEAHAALIGTELRDEDVQRAGAILAAAADPVDDVRGSAEYRRLLIPGLLARAIRGARARESNDE
jgi:carbon-monoxide dehydrogenase medium subunit